eukprot:COSAG02_NODE_33470_length_502_cov_1.187500_1_plen_41_part_10
MDLMAQIVDMNHNDAIQKLKSILGTPQLLIFPGRGASTREE